MSRTPAQKAFDVLRRNLDEEELSQLSNIIGIYLEEKWQIDLANEIEAKESEE